jgi:hypothetical protein
MNDQEDDRPWFTFILSVAGFICLMAWIAWPKFFHNGHHNPMNACINNLRQWDGAVQQWALENHKQPEAFVTMSNAMDYTRPNSRIECPANGKYSVGAAVSNSPRCSIASHVLPP